MYISGLGITPLMPPERSFYVAFQTEGQAAQEPGAVDRVCPRTTWGLLPIKSAVFLPLGISDALASPAFCLQANASAHMSPHLGWDYCLRVDDRVMEAWDAVQRGGPRSHRCYPCTPLDMDRRDPPSSTFAPCAALIPKPSQFLGDGGAVLPWVHLSTPQSRSLLGHTQAFEVKPVSRRAGVRS